MHRVLNRKVDIDVYINMNIRSRIHIKCIHSPKYIITTLFILPAVLYGETRGLKMIYILMIMMLSVVFTNCSTTPRSLAFYGALIHP